MAQKPREPIEVVIRNLLTVHRFGNSLADLTDSEIEELFGRLAAVLVEHDPTAGTASDRRISLAAILERVNAEIGPTFMRLVRSISDALAGFAGEQAEVAAVHLRAILGAGNAGVVEAAVLTPAQLRAIIDGPITGAPLDAWFSNQARAARFQIERQLQLGLARGELVDDLVRRIRGRFVGYRNVDGKRARKYVGGVLDTTTRHAAAIARTAANHVSAAAAETTFQQNADILSGVEWIAALDGRTCLQCAPLDGRTWKLDDTSRPRPPLHMGDRCVLAPVPDWSLLGLEPPPSGTRATKIDPKTGKPGQVSSDVHYEEWLKAQSEALQNEILGPGRAKLFRDGKVTLRDLVRTDGRRVPLAELAAA